MYIERKFGQPYQAEMKRVSKEFLVAKKRLRKHFYFQSYQTKVDAGHSSILTYLLTYLLHGAESFLRS